MAFQGKDLRSDMKDLRGGNRDSRGEKSFKGKESRGSYNKDFGSKDSGNKDYRGGNKDFRPSNKDSYGSKNDMRGPASAGSKKEKEKQPDKIEKFNRLEKEKKAMARREEELTRKKPTAKVVKPEKRVNNKNWTREYEEGIYDEYESLYEE